MAGGLFTAIYSGMIIAWADTQATPPTGWLFCDGSLKSRSDYSDLFNAVGHTFNGGVDPGSNQFKLPNFVNNYPRGTASSGSAAAPGYYDGSASHAHSFTTAFSINSVTGGHVHNVPVIPGQNFNAYVDNAGGHAHTINFGANNAGSGLLNTGKQTTPDASTAQSHTHPTSGAAASSTDGAHSHDASLGSMNSNAHTHTVNVTNSSHNLPVANDTVSGSNDPKYNLVKYIIKT